MVDAWPSQSHSATRSGPTHEVVNQVPPLEPYNVFEQDRILVEAVEREGGGWAADRARALGEIAGGEAAEWGRLANENEPILRTHDRYGHRIDEVEYHPSYHRLMEVTVSNGHPFPALDRPAARRARRARGAVHGHGPGRGRAPVPDLDDLLRRARAARDPRARAGVGAAPHLQLL